MKLNNPIGQMGEDAALNFLLQQGFSLITRNWHCRFGEIDLIMRGSNLLLFVEVKYRKNNRFGGAAFSITPSKLAKLQRTIESYLLQNPHDGACRLDAILIEGDALQWLKNITG